MKQPANNEVVLRDANGEWLCFRTPQKVLFAHTFGEVSAVLDEISAWNGWAAGYVAYEAAPAFDAALPAKTYDKPLAWFGLYDKPQKVDLVKGGPALSPDWKFDVTKAVYASKITQVKDYIKKGQTYQVNYTLRLLSEVSDPWRFFCSKMSNAEFSAYIQTDQMAISSASPELFFEIDGNDITCCPMKGTARNAEVLAGSVKDQAENIMIVDMMRNDLGRICEPESIVADPLFAVQPYERIWQMTSTVTGRTEATISEIFKALFPCASITGAPKFRTMQIIDELETTPRGVYCGAIGYMAPNRTARFSVAIRTAEIDHKSGDAVYGVGGGIVWDSQAESEWNECALKAEILGNIKKWKLPGDFQLLETMLYDDGIACIDEHIERLSHSAAELKFRLDVDDLKARLSAITGERQHLRLLLGRNGDITLESYPFPEQEEALRNVAFSIEPIDPDNLLLYHKTTQRAIYESAKTSVSDVDDVILWNTRGEVTESTIANIVAEIDGQLATPPISSGLLPGTMRAELLKNEEIIERIITMDELRMSPRIFLINSLRGWMPAALAVQG
ncbi:MAG: aminodeoxychorismate synthase component I [Kiritimatiellia bacterium]